MAYFLSLFSPETYEGFSKSKREYAGFRARHRKVAARVKAGDKLVCYLTRLSRWCGVFEVIDGPFDDDTPVFSDQKDPYSLRFRIRVIAWLPIESAVPVHDPAVWNALTWTRGHDPSASAWTGRFRGSLNQIPVEDGTFLENLILAQLVSPNAYPLEESDRRHLAGHRVRRVDSEVSVTVPDRDDEDRNLEVATGPRESIKMQAPIADLGSQMGFSVWIPRSDRERVSQAMSQSPGKLIELLPLNYDDTTLKTIEQIDVIWLKGRSIIRAFEVEHTTSIYSGILRMADLLALQPNMNIRLHIVAPEERKEKVFNEIRRPVFSLLERAPLAECCSYLSYEHITEIAQLPHLAHLSDSIIDEYAEEAE